MKPGVQQGNANINPSGLSTKHSIQFATDRRTDTHFINNLNTRQALGWERCCRGSRGSPGLGVILTWELCQKRVPGPAPEMPTGLLCCAPGKPVFLKYKYKE